MNAHRKFRSGLWVEPRELVIAEVRARRYIVALHISIMQEVVDESPEEEAIELGPGVRRSTLLYPSMIVLLMFTGGGR
jgi:hypothetical protein